MFVQSDSEKGAMADLAARLISGHLMSIIDINKTRLCEASCLKPLV